MDTLLFSLDSRVELANAIIKHANECVNMEEQNKVQLGELRIQKFSDGELCVDFTDSVRGKRVYLLSSPNTSDEIIKLTLAMDAARRSGANEIIPVLPYFPYARQDKKDQSRGPIGAKVIASMIELCGATSIITFDLHADQIQGFFNIPVIHIQGKNVFDEYISKIYTEDTILCGPDAGSGKRVKRMKDQMSQYFGINLNYIMLDKTRKEANVVDEMIIIGDVTGKDVIILDDMVDTAGTLCKAAEVIKDAGAKSVRAIIAHGVLSGPAFERIGDSKLTELIISDSLRKPFTIDVYTKYPLNMVNDGEKLWDSIAEGDRKIVEISVAKQIGLGISALNNNFSYECLKTNCQ